MTPSASWQSRTTTGSTSTSASRATARLRSLPSSGLFTAIFVPDALREAVSDGAWLQALTDAEGALAAAEARAGVIPAEAAEAIGSACRAERFDPEAIGREG